MPEAIHIHTRVDSETLTLAELRPFLGKSVEITVREDVVAPKRPNVDLLEKLAKEIDFNEASEKAFWELRRLSTVFPYPKPRGMCSATISPTSAAPACPCPFPMH